VAALTATLENANPAGGIVKPLGRVSNVFGTLASAGKGFIDAYAQNEQYVSAQESKNALNDAEQKAFDKMKGAQLDMEYGRVAATAIPDEVIAAGTKLDKIKGAVNQGTMPAGAVNLHLENTIEELFQLHPENKAAIAQYFQSRGYDHYVFRDLKNQLEWQETAEDNRKKNEEFVIDAGIKAGLVGPNDDRLTQLAAGQTYLLEQSRMKAAQDKLTFLKTSTEIDEITRKRGEEEGGRDLVKSFAGQADMIFGSYERNFTALSVEASQDPTGTKWQELQKQMPLLATSFQQAKSAAVAQAYEAGAKPEHIQQIKDIYDNKYNAFVQIYTGELSDVKARQNVLTSMQTNLGIDAATSFPLYTELAKLPGMQNALPLIFGSDPSMALGPDTLKALKAELSGFSPGSMKGMYQIQRAAAIIRGDASLKSYSAEEAKQVLPTLLAAVNGNRTAIRQGATDDGTVKGFMNSFGNTLDAAFALEPGTPMSSQKKAADIVGHPDTWEALSQLSRDPARKQQAEEVIDSMIGTAAKGLEVAKMTGPMKSANGVFKIEFNRDRRRFEIKADETAYKTWARANEQTGSSVSRFGYLPSNVPSFEEMARKGDPQLNEKLKTMNGYLQALLWSKEHNQDVPKNAGNMADYADFFATGKRLPGLKPDQGVPDFTKRLNDLTGALATETLKNLESQSVDDITANAATQYGISPNLGKWLIGAEGTGRTQIDVNKDGKPDSTATGYGQFIDGTARQYGLLGEGFDYRNDPTKAVPASMRYLSELIKKNGGDVIKALTQYGVLDRRNFPAGPEGDRKWQAKIDSAKRAAGLG